MAGQASSSDVCPEKLHEAKHRLKQLHKPTYSVAFEINSTSTEVKHVPSEIKHLELEWTTDRPSVLDGRQKCTTETESYYKQLEVLNCELIEMKQVANSAVHISASDRSYAAWKCKVESSFPFSYEETTLSSSELGSTRRSWWLRRSR